ncbi:MAG: ABC transporter ATP-binding protein [Deltaproteobacteria bacterium]|nr:ABC transporter ATP-binding protein [Deltaproteobacteria bacterium]
MKKNIFSLENISASYGNTSVFKNIELNIENSELTAICGPNGSGKTTLLKILAGLNPPSEGIVTFMDKNLEFFTGIELAEKRSYVSQHLPSDLDTSVVDILEMGLYHSTGWFLKKSESKHIENAVKLFNLEKIKNRIYRTLSGGEKRRVFLARGFVQCPHVMLLDEPTVFLDIAQTEQFIEVVRKIRKQYNSTIICVSHDISMVLNNFPKIILMGTGGKKTISGDTSEILHKFGHSYFDIPLSISRTDDGTQFVLTGEQCRKL